MKPMLKKIMVLAMLVTWVAELPAEPPAGSGEKTNDVTKVWANGRGKDSLKWPVPVALFAADLSNADFTPGAWVSQDGIISAKGSGDLWTKDNYGNFALTLDFRCAEGANSGILLRCSDTQDWLNNSIEVQILQGEVSEPRHATGAIFDCLAPRRVITVKAGEWQRLIVIAEGKNITVSLNGEEVTKMNLDDWNEAGKNPDGSANKFKKALKDFAREGRIGLQYHGSQVEFRNVRIEKF